MYVPKKIIENASDFVLSEESDNDIRELGDDWIPECIPEKKPYVNQKFPDTTTAFKFYHDYAKMCGIDVRKSSEKKNLLKQQGNIFCVLEQGQMTMLKTTTRTKQERGGLFLQNVTAQQNLLFAELAKIKECWFEFQACISEAAGNP